MNTEKLPQKPTRLSFWQTVSSVLAAFFGVQSSKARKRDFSNGDPFAFFAVALLLTALFVLALITIVRLVMHYAVTA